MGTKRRSLVACLAGALVVLLAAPASAAYPGRNGRIAYNSGYEPEVAIMTTNVDGSNVKQLTFTDAFHEPSYSANGRRIVYVRGEYTFAPTHIGLMNADGTDKRRVPFHDSEELWSPSFSPSGKRIIVTRWNNGHGSVWTLRTDGTDRRKVAPQLEGIVSGGVYSPGGKRIAFSFRPEGADYSSIYTIRVDGTGLRRLTGGTHLDAGPDYSPDGSRLAFLRTRKDHSKDSIHRMRSDGTGETNVTSYDGPGGLGGPRWSPDGRWISFTKVADSYTARLVRPDGSDNHRLIDGSGYSFAPAWQPLPR